MNILVAMDSFKEALSAADVCAAVRAGLLRADANCNVTSLPLSDGGEGMLACLFAAGAAEERQSFGMDLAARADRFVYGVCADGTAVIETAETCGLSRLSAKERNPMLASSRGVGEQMRAALDAGCRKLVVALGGSGCVDGGMGALAALGVRFLDADGKELSACGAAMSEVAAIETSEVHPALAETEVMLAADVQNPYCGARGAAVVFGPQKGATPEMVASLDAGLANLAQVFADAGLRDVRALAGAGAAGGLGGGLAALTGAKICSGFSVLADAVAFDRLLADCDFVITGEGKTDAQTVYGKLPMQVATRAQAAGKPTFCLSGSLGAGASSLYTCGMTALWSIADKPMALGAAIGRTAELLADSAEALLRTIAAFAPKRKRR